MATSHLLLLGLCVTMFLVTEGIPPGFTPAQWFNEQHVQYPKTDASSDNAYCNSEMRRLNQHFTLCKDFNSFLHYPLNNVIMVCYGYNITCKNGVDKNCYNSTTAVSITDCRWTSGAHPNCRYSGGSKQAYFVVACRRPLPADHSRRRLLPVHLDST
ncbi:ribonuclease 7-like [Trichosurus vulpecula]|uniref:ribonuclease 7-like n=1 Tax=Trichosurus vulpecula TaxID=9337 RepID=UPI00186B3627|nr:ribonuclease 7-like [Trichosurus vulpecula]